MNAIFFSNWIVDFIHQILIDSKNNLIIYVVGLDQDSFEKTFGPMGDLMAMADEVRKITAICFKCGQEATMTIKKTKGHDIEPGDIDLYEARCRNCWQPPQT